MVVKGSCPGQLVELLGERTVMGRPPSCQIVLDNAAVSRNHAQILESHGTYYLEDLRSRNGTLLNGKKIQGRTQMGDRDEIRVCEVVLRFYEGMPEDSESTPVPIQTSYAPPDAAAVEALRQQLRTISGDDELAMAAAKKDGAKKDGKAKFDDLGSDSSSIITSLDIKNRAPRIIVRPEA